MTPLAQKNPEPWLLLEITTECNLRCKHCHHWLSSETPAALSTEEKIRVVREFQEWKKGGKVVFAGGEVLLKPEEVIRLAGHCSALGLHSTALTNATLLNENLAKALLQSGISQISISLDAPAAKAYDFSRGVSGTFEKAVKAIQLLANLRAELGVKASLYISTILKRGTLALLPAHLEFVRGLGVDGIFLFPLEATFANSSLEDPFYEKERLRPDAASREAFEFLLAYEGNRGFIQNSREDLEAMRMHLFSGEAAPCVAGERNLVVDLNGNLRFCHLMEEHISEGKILGNIREGNLRDLCENPTALRYRDLMLGCEKPCASLNCNRPTVV